VAEPANVEPANLEPANLEPNAAPDGRLAAFLKHPSLPRRLALIACLLACPSLLIGFHLDDHFHRYMLSQRPGAEALLEAYQSPFGIANGEREINHWQVEEGYAPWWIEEDLLVSLFRPLSEASHRLDALLWPDNAPLQHLHSLLWFFLLIALTTRLYRALLGPTTVAGLAALLYAFDHSHGFAVGWIANRNAAIATALAVASLLCHHRGRISGSTAMALLSPLLLLGALLAGEGAIAIVGYLVSYALFLERSSWPSRLRSIAPHLLLIALWRLAYSALGRGAHGSGLYLDPPREPLVFAAAAVERIPLLLLGELALPPAETALFAPAPYPSLILALSLLVLVVFGVCIAPLLARDETARFWALGMAAALVPACSTHPNNRLLFFVGLGAMALLSQLWHGLMLEALWLPAAPSWHRLARPTTAGLTGLHLVLSPLLLPLTTCSVALTSPAEHAARDALTRGAERDLIVVSAPDYFYVKLIPVLAALENKAPPARLRALSFGSHPLEVSRPDARTLELHYQGGLLSQPLDELYRAADSPLPIGSRIDLAGLRIEVTAVERDGRVKKARFVFDRPLDDRRFVWLSHGTTGFDDFQLPPVGGSTRLAPAQLNFGF